MNKEQERMWNAYCDAKATQLHEVYTKFSREKYNAFHDCIKEKVSREGYDGRITAANSWQFSYAFRYKKDDKEWLFYITKNHNKTFPLE